MFVQAPSRHMFFQFARGRGGRVASRHPVSEKKRVKLVYGGDGVKVLGRRFLARLEIVYGGNGVEVLGSRLFFFAAEPERAFPCQECSACSRTRLRGLLELERAVI